MDGEATRFHTSLAGNLKRLRKLRGYSQVVLAERAGISQTYLAAIESCRKFPRPETLESLCRALTARPFHLFLDEALLTLDDDVTVALVSDDVAKRVRTAVSDALEKTSQD